MQSMTGFAETRGGDARQSWRWEIRAVNGRTLDLRFRLPDGAEGLEPPMRKLAQARFKRGSLTLSLRLGKTGATAPPLLNEAALAAGLDALTRVRDLAEAAGIVPTPPSLPQLLALPGVYTPDAEDVMGEERRAALLEDGEATLDRLAEARRAEGAAICAVLDGQIDAIGHLTVEARATAEARAATTRALLRSRVEALLEMGSGLDEDRLAVELAQIAVRSDVTEELDRLDAHVAAARALLSAKDAVGRKFDFLAQEFHREANTLCAKAGSAALTDRGLALKVAIDQMREQVQNVE